MTLPSTLLLLSLLSCPWMTPGKCDAARFRSELVTHQGKEIPTVGFCQMVKHPQLYFDRTIRITATVEPRIEGTTLNDVRCVRSYDDQIGLGTVEVEKQAASLAKGFEKIRSGMAGEQPRVTAIGILRNKLRRDFEWYRYRFDIIAFEDIHQDVSETIITYGGTLGASTTYRATVRSDKNFGLAPVPPLRILLHQAARLEWINLKEFRALEQLRGSSQRQIVFRVRSDDIHEMNQRRWNRTLQLEILSRA